MAAIDSTEFRRLVDPLIGLPITRIWDAHGSTIFFEIGEQAEIDGLVRGVASLMISWGWRVEKNRSISFGSASDAGRIGTLLPKLASSTVKAIEVTGQIPELRVDLSSGQSICTFALFESQPNWAILLGGHGAICVKRGSLFRQLS